MKFRFKINEVLATPAVAICGDAGSVNLNNINLAVSVGGTSVGSATNLSTGLTIPAFPLVAADGVTVNGFAFEGNEVMVIDIDLPNIWDTTKISITASKPRFNTYSNIFKVFGYDLGNNAAVNNPAGDPINYNPDTTIYLVPNQAGTAAATSGVITVSVGNTFTINADDAGTQGNGIQIIGDGVNTITQLVNTYNTTLPPSTLSLVITGTAATYVPPNLTTYTLAGGTDAAYEYAYSRFIGWVQPFTNTEYVYCASSSLGEVEYYAVVSGQPDALISKARNFVRCCSDTDIKKIVSIYENTSCGQQTLIDSCTSATSSLTTYNLVPAYDFSVLCLDCCTDSCITLLGTTKIYPVVDATNVDQMFVDDVEGYEPPNVDISYELVNAKGEIVSSDQKTVSVIPPFDSDANAWTVVLPVIGDYHVKSCILVEDVYECCTTKTFTACHYYDIEKTGCSDYKISNYTQASASIVISKLNKDKVFVAVETVAVAACEYLVYTFASDGVYSLVVDGQIDETLIVAVDCALRNCFVAKLKNLVCSTKLTCNCGSTCTGSCSSIASDLYDFNAFMALVYGYYSLINLEYLNFYIYSALEPTDIDRFYNIDQFLCRVEEYCAACVEPVYNTQSGGDCGCN